MEKQADKSDLYLANVKDYQSLFKSESGQRVLWDMMKACDFTGAKFESDPSALSYNAGTKFMVSRILNILGMNEEKLYKYIAERKEADEYERYNING